MNEKHVLIFINGILTRPGDSENWNGRAATWTNLHRFGSVVGERFEYHVGPVSRIFGQKKRAWKLLGYVEHYAKHGFKIGLVAHSNGANVVRHCLGLCSEFQLAAIEKIHLFAPAAPADFEKNGFNQAGRPVVVHVAAADRALWFATTAAGRLLGYGGLGVTGPINATVEADTRIYPALDHSDTFRHERFVGTMNELLDDFGW